MSENNKLIFLDVDATLYSKEQRLVPESAIKAIHAAQKNGHKVLINTGRPLVYFEKDGTEYLKQPMVFDIYRAPTDNDGNISEKWKEAQLHHAMVRVYESSAWQRQDGWSVRMYFSMAGVSRQKFFEGNVECKRRKHYSS